MLKLQYFGHLMWRAHSLEKTLMLREIEGRRRRGRRRMRWLDGIINLMDMNLSKLQEIVEDRGDWCATAHGITKSQTQLSNWTTKTVLLQEFFNMHQSRKKLYKRSPCTHHSKLTTVNSQTTFIYIPTHLLPPHYILFQINSRNHSISPLNISVCS